LIGTLNNQMIVDHPATNLQEPACWLAERKFCASCQTLPFELTERLNSLRGSDVNALLHLQRNGESDWLSCKEVVLDLWPPTSDLPIRLPIRNPTLAMKHYLTQNRQAMPNLNRLVTMLSSHTPSARSADALRTGLGFGDL
jgi:hypothetical protein